MPVFHRLVRQDRQGRDFAPSGKPNGVLDNCVQPGEEHGLGNALVQEGTVCITGDAPCVAKSINGQLGR